MYARTPSWYAFSSPEANIPGFGITLWSAIPLIASKPLERPAGPPWSARGCSIDPGSTAPFPGARRSASGADEFTL